MTAAAAGVGRGRGGLPHVVLRGSDGSTADVYLHGAHVTSWRTADGAEQLYLSELALFDGRAAIRGGIPVIFPQFASEGPLPKHGFARTMPWMVVDALPALGAEVTLELRDTPATRAHWDASFVARLHVRVGPDGLSLGLVVRNVGTAAMKFTAALHTYLATPQDARTRVRGLSGCSFRDASDPGPTRPQDGDLVVDGAINRVYLAVPDTIRAEFPDRTVRLRSVGLPDLVVWNPGAGAAGLADMPGADAGRMLCLEPAAIGSAVAIGPGTEWRGIHRLSVEPD